MNVREDDEEEEEESSECNKQEVTEAERHL